MSIERELLKGAVEWMHELKYAWVEERDWGDRDLLYLVADIKRIEELLAQPEPLTPREDLREEITLRDATNDGLRKEIASLRTANDRQEADLRLAKTALAETMKLFNNQPNDSGLRDHFAGLAMQGLLNGNDMYSAATKAYYMADAMLAERSKRDE